MSTPSPMPPVVHRSRTRRLARWLVVTLVSGFVLVTLWNLARREWVRAEGARELSAAVSEAESDDPDWTWEKLNAARRKPPQGKNGADLIARVRALMPAEWTRDANPEQWAPDPQQWQPNVRYPNRVVSEVRRNLGRAGPALELARNFKDLPNGHRALPLTPDVLSTPMRDTPHTRTVALLLRWDAALSAEDADAPRLADALLAGLNASRSVGDEPMLISQLVRVATRAVATQALERAFAQADIPDADLTRLQSAWAADAEEPLLLYGVRGERAAYDVFLRNMCDGTVTPDNIGGGRNAGISFGGYAWWLWRVNLLKNRAFYLRYMTKATQAARKPPHEQLAAVAELPLLPDDDTYRIAALILPAVDRVAAATLRSTAETRCAAVGIACERFQQKHGRWPDSLAELAPALLPAVPLDPYDGQPLRYAKWADGVAVYSVGKKPTQTHGFQSPAEPAKPGLPEGVEFGFRLWNPDRRRLPPPPDPANLPPE